MPAAMHAPRVARSQRMGLFWETYGVRPEGETFTYALLVEPVGEGWMSRAFTRLGLKDKPSALSLQWQEVPEAVDRMASRGLALDLSPLKPGPYRVRLTLSSTATVPITSERYIEVLP